MCRHADTPEVVSCLCVAQRQFCRRWQQHEIQEFFFFGGGVPNIIVDRPHKTSGLGRGGVVLGFYKMDSTGYIASSTCSPAKRESVLITHPHPCMTLKMCRQSTVSGGWSVAPRRKCVCRAALGLKKIARADHYDILEKRRLGNADADSTRASESRRSHPVEFYWSQTSSTANATAHRSTFGAWCNRLHTCQPQ